MAGERGLRVDTRAQTINIVASNLVIAAWSARNYYAQIGAEVPSDATIWHLVIGEWSRLSASIDLSYDTLIKELGLKAQKKPE